MTDEQVAAIVDGLRGGDLPLGSCDRSECKERIVRAVLDLAAVHNTEDDA